MENGSRIGRVAALAGVVLVAIALAVVLLTGGNDYTVKARFENASQIVKGNLVEVGGVSAGKVTGIRLTDDNQAELTLTIDPAYAPLRRGTFAVVRQTSLSGIANRYVDLMLGSGTAPEIRDGGVIGTQRTQAAVDLDAVFSTFDPKTRTALARDLKGFADSYAGSADDANQALRYLNPALAASARLFSELNRNKALFERFLVQSAGLFTDVAARKDDLQSLVTNLATTSSALARRRVELGASIQELPGFMRKANTTFVNLRATLNDLRPLVRSSKPVVRKLGPLLDQLRPFARDAVPTVRDLSQTISAPGAGNDLIELLQAQPPLRDIALGPVEANGKTREGAFPASTRALSSAAPELAFARPYSVDLSAWFDDFSQSGAYDALGSFSRAGLALSAFTFSPVLNSIIPVPPALRPLVFGANTSFGRNNRCPGSDERNPGDNSTTWKPTADFNCDPTQVPVGP